MNRSTLSYSRVIVLLRLIAIFFAECLLCLTITEKPSTSNLPQIQCTVLAEINLRRVSFIGVESKLCLSAMMLICKKL